MDLLVTLRRTARNFANRPAVVDGETRLTWRAVDERTKRLATGLRGLGLKPGDRVAVLRPGGWLLVDEVDHVSSLPDPRFRGADLYAKERAATGQVTSAAGFDRAHHARRQLPPENSFECRPR